MGTGEMVAEKVPGQCPAQKIQQLKEKGAYLLYLADCFAPDKSYTFYYENKKYELLKAEKTTSS